MASGKRTIILCVILHLYMIISAFLFQKFEYKSSEMETPHTDKAKISLMRDLNITEEEAEEIIDDIFTAKTKDQKIWMASVWKSFPKALWFVMTLFTTVGKFQFDIYSGNFSSERNETGEPSSDIEGETYRPHLHCTGMTLYV